MIENSKIKKNNVAINSKTEKILFNQDKYIYIYSIQTIKTRCGLIIYLYIYINSVYLHRYIYNVYQSITYMTTEYIIINIVLET